MAKFNLFNSIRIKKPSRNAFDLSHDVKLSMNMGDLIPIFCEPVVPGDTFKVTTEMLMRFAPLSAPVMHDLNVYTHFFFVPNRLVWDGWQDFITGGSDNRSKNKRVPAYPWYGVVGNGDGNISWSFMTDGSLLDYLGYPTVKDYEDYNARFLTGSYASSDDRALKNNFVVDALSLRAYHLIWNEYYRDQNLQDEIDIHKERDGYQRFSQNDAPLFMKHKRAWEKDYFTSALPWPQAGEDVNLPMRGAIDIPSTRNAVILTAASTGGGTVETGNIAISDRPADDDTVPLSGSNTLRVGDKYAQINGWLDIPEQHVDFENVTQTTINEFRRALKAQEFLELRARGGGRYIEQILSFFGVKSSDARLQRPEYLGGGKSPVMISDVQQVSQTTNGDDPSAQGTLTGQAASVQRSHSFKRFFEEHGYIIGIMSVLPRTAYQQGIPRKFTKFDSLDYYWPQFAHLGEQSIENRELYFDASDQKNPETFGYTPRYAEYKYIPSRVCGDFRNQLNFWHMGRIFNNRPNLNGDFVTFKGDNRIFADTNDDYNKLWVNIKHHVSALRPMPVYGTPLL